MIRQIMSLLRKEPQSNRDADNSALIWVRAGRPNCAATQSARGAAKARSTRAGAEDKRMAHPTRFERVTSAFGG